MSAVPAYLTVILYVAFLIALAFSLGLAARGVACARAFKASVCFIAGELALWLLSSLAIRLGVMQAYHFPDICALVVGIIVALLGLKLIKEAKQLKYLTAAMAGWMVSAMILSFDYKGLVQNPFIHGGILLASAFAGMAAVVRFEAVALSLSSVAVGVFNAVIWLELRRGTGVGLALVRQLGLQIMYPYPGDGDSFYWNYFTYWLAFALLAFSSYLFPHVQRADGLP